MTTPQKVNLQNKHSATVGTLIYLLFGLIAWGIQFTTVYMMHTLICTIGARPSTASAFVIVLSVAIASALVVALFNGDKLARVLGVGADVQSRTTYDGIFRLIAIISIVAIVWSGAAALIVTACR